MTLLLLLACGADGDGDGYRGGDDCDDGDRAVHPGAEEVCDGMDNDCDVWIDIVSDGAGGHVEVCAGTCPVLDCATAEPHDSYGVPEVCGDGLDNNCDGVVDEESCAIACVMGTAGATAIGGLARARPEAELWATSVHDAPSNTFGVAGFVRDDRALVRSWTWWYADDRDTYQVTPLLTRVGGVATAGLPVGFTEPGGPFLEFRDIPEAGTVDTSRPPRARIPPPDGWTTLAPLDVAPTPSGHEVLIATDGEALVFVWDGTSEAPPEASARLRVVGQPPDLDFVAAGALLAGVDGGVQTVLSATGQHKGPGDHGEVYIFGAETSGTVDIADADAVISFSHYAGGNALRDAGDLNGDGSTDLLVHDGFGTTALFGPWAGTADYLDLAQVGESLMAVHSSTDSTGFLFAGYSRSDDRLYVTSGVADGTTPLGELLPSYTWPLEAYIGSVAFADVDADGNVEVLTSVSTDWDDLLEDSPGLLAAYAIPEELR